MSMKSLVGLIIVLLLVVLGSQSLFRVHETERAILLQFGEIMRADVKPGLHFKMPIAQEAKIFDARVLTLDSNSETYYTLEKKPLEVDSFVKWRVADVASFYESASFDIRRAERLLQERVNEGLRNQISRRDMHEVVSGERDQLMAELRADLDEKMRGYGVEVVDVRVKRIDLPVQVSSSVYERMNSEREIEARQFRAEGQEEALAIRAGADRQAVVIEAEAYRESEQIRGEGDAQSAAIYAAAFNKDPEFYEFYRSINAYVNVFSDKSDLMIIDPSSDFFKYLDKEGQIALLTSRQTDTMKSHWRLPRGVDELLPPAAWQLELLRRKVLDLFDSWGFEYVDPPVIEYLDALLVGSGEDLDLQTLKVVDQVSGRQLGVRADMTSQAVRIDAHSMVTDEVQRLCYAGPVVFANPQITQNSRVPFKAGAEIFGAAGIDADAEVIALMLSTVQEARIEEPVLLLGHMGIYLGLVAQLIAEGSLAAEDEGRLFTCVQRKSQADIRALLQKTPCSEMMTALPLMMGEPAVMGGVHQQLSGAPESVLQALEELQSLAEQVSELYPGLRLRLDVSELSGYGYHNGPVYAVYHPTHGSALAQGGRYDDVGEVFGRLRPATGFDVNLKLLINTATNRNIIFAPYVPPQQRSALLLEIATLRAAGERVQCALSSEERPPSACQRVLAQVEGKWQVVER